MSSSAGDPGVRGVPERAIHERQLDDDMVRLQRAAAAVHQRGQLLEAARVIASVLLAVLGVLATLLGHGRAVVSITGFFWFAVSVLLLKGLSGITTRRGALLQEMFDTSLFRLPWHTTVTGDPISDPEVRRLARRIRRGGKQDQRITNGWYDPTHGVHHPYDIFIAQEQNLAWDARLRRRYSYVIAAAASAWTSIGLILGLAVANTTLQDTLLSFFIPSLAAYGIAHEAWLAQRKVAEQRERLAKVVSDELHNGQPGHVADAECHRLRLVSRDVQDGIFQSRLETARVPDFFYRRFRNSDEQDFGDTAEGHRARLAGETPRLG